MGVFASLIISRSTLGYDDWWISGYTSIDVTTLQCVVRDPLQITANYSMRNKPSLGETRNVDRDT